MGCVLTFVDALHDVKYFVICYASVVQCFDDSVFGGRVLLLQHEPKTNRRMGGIMISALFFRGASKQLRDLTCSLQMRFGNDTRVNAGREQSIELLSQSADNQLSCGAVAGHP